MPKEKERINSSVVRGKAGDRCRGFRETFDRVALIQIRHLSAELFLIFGHPKEAIPWILLNRNAPIQDSRADLLHYSRVLFLMAHFELDNFRYGRAGNPLSEDFLGPP